jgi:hypothetical protein
MAKLREPELRVQFILRRVIPGDPTLVSRPPHSLGLGWQTPLVRVCVSEEPRLDLRLRPPGSPNRVKELRCVGCPSPPGVPRGKRPRSERSVQHARTPSASRAPRSFMGSLGDFSLDCREALTTLVCPTWVRLQGPRSVILAPSSNRGLGQTLFERLLSETLENDSARQASFGVHRRRPLCSSGGLFGGVIFSFSVAVSAATISLP